ncbi:MAG: hypothetical protein HY529_03030 [Chloroflexi bacterium]|nr:hypothetical protein [Chloroflexota bacterium]
MNKKISRILGVGLSLMMLVSLITMAAPASASTLSWGTETPVDDLKANVDNILATSGVSIASLAVNGSTMYAVTGATNNITYKSTNAGATWSSLASTTDYPVGLAISLVSVAPDDANAVAILVASDQSVRFSSNGGASWSNLLIPVAGATVQAIDVSPVDSSGIRYIAASGTVGGAATLWTEKLFMGEAWTDRSTGAGNFTAGTSMPAVRFSPKFLSDKVISVVTGNATDVTFQLFRYETGAFTWNSSIAFLDASWMAGITLTAKLDLWAGDTLTAASIAMGTTFNGREAGDRIAFVGIAGNVDGGGVVRVTDSFPRQFETWSAGNEGPIGSVSLHSSGKLLAGDFDANQVFVSLSPMASEPRFERLNTLKQPGGQNMTQVAWSGTTAVAATSGDESAFSISTDDGNSFNDISLINATLTTLTDVAVSGDGKKYYLTSRDADNDISVWVNDGKWARVLTLRDYGTAKILLRVAPEDASSIYVGAVGSQDIWVSKNSGKASWKSVPVYKLSTLTDFVVQSTDILHAISASQYSKSVDAGATWTTSVGMDDAIGHNIALAPNNDVLVGDTQGFVAFSKDNGATFKRTRDFGTGNAYPVADKDYATNNVIYVGVGKDVKRGKADTTTDPSTRGDVSNSGLLANYVVTGMLRHDIHIYAMAANATSSALWRALELTPTVGSTQLALWSYRAARTSTGTSEKLFAAEPSALKISPTADTGPKLWSIDNDASMALNSLNDPIVATPPTVKAPADKTTVSINPESGEAYNVTFSWSKYDSTNVHAMDLEIATDSAFTAVVFSGTRTLLDKVDVASVIGPTAAEALFGLVSNRASFNPGDTYYWRVRHSNAIGTGQTDADRNFLSPWSVVRSFVIAPPIPFDITSPTKGATGVATMPTFVWTADKTATAGFEIAVSEDPTFAILDWSHTVPKDSLFYKTVASDELRFNTTYYVRVRAVTGTATTARGPWVNGIFTTAEKPVAPTPPVVITPTPPTPPPQIVTVQVPVPGPPQPIPSYLLWLIIAIGAILIIALIVLIVRTRRVA